MTAQLTRTYKKLDVNQIKPHLLIYGDLSGACANCNAMDIKLDVPQCPQCKSAFTYLAFRNVPNHIPKILKLMDERPNLLIIDYDDYKRNLGVSRAHDLLK